MSVKKERVYWTDDEKKMIVDKACEILEEQHCGVSLSLLHEAIRQSLPHHRWRKLISFSVVDWFKPDVNRRLRNREEERKRSQTVKSEAEKTTQEPPEEKTLDVYTSHRETPSVSFGGVEPMINEVLKRLFAPVVERIINDRLMNEEFLSRFTSLVSSQVIGAMRSQKFSFHVDTPKTETNKKKSVLVAGVINDQVQEITRDFGDIFDLRFIDSGRASAASLKATQRADFVVIMTRFVDHSTQNALKQPGTNIVWCNGGVSELKSKLTELIDRL